MRDKSALPNAHRCRWCKPSAGLRNRVRLNLGRACCHAESAGKGRLKMISFAGKCQRPDSNQSVAATPDRLADNSAEVADDCSTIGHLMTVRYRLLLPDSSLARIRKAARSIHKPLSHDLPREAQAIISASNYLGLTFVVNHEIVFVVPVIEVGKRKTRRSLVANARVTRHQ